MRFLFQPAEESKADGAPGFITAGVLDGLSDVSGFHLNASNEYWNVCRNDGAAMAGSIRMPHYHQRKKMPLAYPESYVDPIGILAGIFLEMDRIKQTISTIRSYLIVPASIYKCGRKMETSTPERGILTLRAIFWEETVERNLRGNGWKPPFGILPDYTERVREWTSANHPRLHGILRNSEKSCVQMRTFFRIPERGYLSPHEIRGFLLLCGKSPRAVDDVRHQAWGNFFDRPT